MPTKTYTNVHASPAVIHELFMWWQYEHMGTMRALSKALGVTPASVYYWAREGMPFKNAKRVVDLTKGVFSMQRLFPELYK